MTCLDELFEALVATMLISFEQRGKHRRHGGKVYVDTFITHVG